MALPQRAVVGSVALMTTGCSRDCHRHELWEGGLRVPTFVYGTGIPAGGFERNTITAQIDWFPTIVGLAGGSLSAGPPLDGLDIWGVIAEGAPTPHAELLHNYDTSSTPTAGFRGALRRGDLKLIVFGKNNSAQLFNLSKDPTETTDLSDALSAVTTQMRSRLEQFGHEAVPCWGGTGAVPNPPGFRGDCDEHPPRMNCTVHVPAVYEPGWCKTAPAPPPAPPGGGFHCEKPVGSFCSHRKQACDADVDHRVHTGNESLGACEALCTANAQCNCLSYTVVGTRAKSLCKLFRGVKALKKEDQRDAYVPGGR